MSGSGSARSDRPLVARLARWRVPLGFLCGVAVLWLATPTTASVALGSAVALVGEVIRVWAAGHLEKGREVTCSGPYRWMGHPLYVGSTVMGIGLAVAARSVPVAILALVYLGTMIPLAIRSEEAALVARFGRRYEEYRRGTVVDRERPFNWALAMRNKEYRALIGFLVAMAILCLKASAMGSE